MDQSNVLWEIERYDWTALDAASHADKVPEALWRLATAVTKEDARAAEQQVDGMVHRNGWLFENSLPAMRCFTAMLPGCSPSARYYVIMLMQVMMTGACEPDQKDFEGPPSQKEFIIQCRRELTYSFGFFLHCIQHGTPKEKEFCLSFVGQAALFEPSLRETYYWYGRQYAADIGKPYLDEDMMREYIRGLEVPLPMGGRCKRHGTHFTVALTGRQMTELATVFRKGADDLGPRTLDFGGDLVYLRYNFKNGGATQTDEAGSLVLSTNRAILAELSYVMTDLAGKPWVDASLAPEIHLAPDFIDPTETVSDIVFQRIEDQ